MVKKLLIVATIAAACVQTSWSRSLGDLNIFNHLGVSVHAATTGFGFEVATPITNFVTVRAGASFMPGFSFTNSFDGTYSAPVPGSSSYDTDFTIDAEASLKRTQGSVIFNLYPFGKHSSFFIAGGGYFGGAQIIGLKGHSDELAGKSDAFIEIGEFELPVDKNGNLNGSLRCNSFRPYLGLGFGRPVPKGRVNVGFELGVQFMGKTKIYNGDTELVANEYLDDDDDWKKWMDKITVYPVLKLTISGRIF